MTASSCRIIWIIITCMITTGKRQAKQSIMWYTITSILIMKRFIWRWSKLNFEQVFFLIYLIWILIIIRPSTRFVTPMMTIERHKRDLRERHKKSPHQTQCHYQGKVRGHEHSKVALSACNGLVRNFLTWFF